MFVWTPRSSRPSGRTRRSSPNPGRAKSSTLTALFFGARATTVGLSICTGAVADGAGAAAGLRATGMLSTLLRFSQVSKNLVLGTTKSFCEILQKGFFISIKNDIIKNQI